MTLTTALPAVFPNVNPLHAAPAKPPILEEGGRTPGNTPPGASPHTGSSSSLSITELLLSNTGAPPLLDLGKSLATHTFTALPPSTSSTGNGGAGPSDREGAISECAQVAFAPLCSRLVVPCGMQPTAEQVKIAKYLEAKYGPVPLEYTGNPSTDVVKPHRAMH